MIGRLARLLQTFACTEAEVTDHPRFPRLRLPELAPSDLLADSFAPIARDGAGLVEVQIRLLKALAALAQVGDERLRDAALNQAERACALSVQALALETDKATVRGLRDDVRRACVATRPPARMRPDRN